MCVLHDPIRRKSTCGPSRTWMRRDGRSRRTRQEPLWARNGQELFYESKGALMQVPVKTGSTFEPGSPCKLLDAPYLVRRPGQGLGCMYDMSADGQRFLVIKEISAADGRPPSPRIIFVQNWFEELKRLVPTN
jgi:hypothetical protein